MGTTGLEIHGLIADRDDIELLQIDESDRKDQSRKLEVLRAASRGERSKEIAIHLGITERTVKAHLDSIYNKLGVDSRAAAVATAIERGLLAK